MGEPRLFRLHGVCSLRSRAAPTFGGMTPGWERADDGALIRAVLGRAGASVAGRALADLLEADARELSAMGLGAGSRARLLAVAEIARRHQPPCRPPRPITAPRHAVQHLAPLRGLATEVLAVLLLDARMGPIGLSRVAEGALSHVTATPREVFGPALSCGAAALVLVHNHPSGQVEPSPEDIDFTRAMKDAGRVLEVAVVDHLIVARRAYYSLREAGLM